jgi:hypothetical protein
MLIPSLLLATACLDGLHGTWRGPGTVLNRPIVMEQSFALAATCVGDTMSSQWLGSTERGRTVYARTADTLVVIDSVYPATAPAREFGRSRLMRAPR